MPDDRKELIAAAAGRLLLRRDGKKLTVTDIVNECHITRQTFYYHFEDIPDLLLWMMKRNLKRNMQEASMQSTPEESLKYLITLSLSSRLFVEKAMHAGYREELERLVMQSFNSLIERILRRWHFPPGCTREQMSLMLRYHLNAVVGLMRSWTEEDSAHIDETVRDIYRMMAASMNAFAPGGATRLPEKLKDLTAESKCKKPLHFGFFVYTGLRKCKLCFWIRRGKIREQTERSAGIWNRTCWRESWRRLTPSLRACMQSCSQPRRWRAQS